MVVALRSLETSEPGAREQPVHPQEKVLGVAVGVSWRGVVQEGGEGCSPGAAEAQPVLSSGAPQAEAWVDTGSMQGWSSPGARMGANPPGVQLDKTIDRSRHHWLPLTSFTVWTSPHSDGTCGQELPNF